MAADNEKLKYEDIKEQVKALEIAQGNLAEVFEKLQKYKNLVDSNWQGTAAGEYFDKMTTLYNNLKPANEELIYSILFLSSVTNSYSEIENESVRKLLEEFDIKYKNNGKLNPDLGIDISPDAEDEDNKEKIETPDIEDENDDIEQDNPTLTESAKEAVEKAKEQITKETTAVKPQPGVGPEVAKTGNEDKPTKENKPEPTVKPQPTVAPEPAKEDKPTKENKPEPTVKPQPTVKPEPAKTGTEDKTTEEKKPNPTVKPTPDKPEKSNDSTPDPKNNKTVDELAEEVINGDWGNGEERKRRLQEAGIDYDTVQGRVNEIVRGVTSDTTSPKRDLDVIVEEVINGDWGNGEERKRKLQAAGLDYYEVQSKVNDVLRGVK